MLAALLGICLLCASNDPTHSLGMILPDTCESLPRQLRASGYHVPAVRRRDMFYAKLEDQRAEALGQI
jgi:hypothetical protein